MSACANAAATSGWSAVAAWMRPSSVADGGCRGGLDPAVAQQRLPRRVVGPVAASSSRTRRLPGRRRGSPARGRDTAPPPPQPRDFGAVARDRRPPIAGDLQFGQRAFDAKCPAGGVHPINGGRNAAVERREANLVSALTIAIRRSEAYRSVACCASASVWHGVRCGICRQNARVGTVIAKGCLPIIATPAAKPLTQKGRRDRGAHAWGGPRNDTFRLHDQDQARPAGREHPDHGGIAGRRRAAAAADVPALRNRRVPRKRRAAPRSISSMSRTSSA